MRSILLFLCLLPSYLLAQNIVINARVVDTETNEALPNATIFVNAEKNRITNIEGEFILEVSPMDMLTISYVGYKPVKIKAENVGPVIKLSPYIVELSEVKVLPLKTILERVVSSLKAETAIYKEQESNFYYRQTTQNNGECCEYIEALINGYSEVAVRQPSIITGRYGGLKNTDTKNYSFVGNYYDMSCISPYTSHKLSKKKLIIPLMADSKIKYNMDYEILCDKANENYIYRIVFTPCSNVKVPIVKGVIYVDADSYKILKYEGDFLNYNIISKKGERFPLKHTFSVIYTYYHGFMEVQNVTTKGTYSQHGISVSINTTLANVGQKYYKGKKKLGDTSNLIQKINSTGYDAKFWNDNTIIKRTSIEEIVMRMFEKDNVFNNMTE